MTTPYSKTTAERREEIATACLAGMLAANTVATTVAASAETAVQYADALLEALGKRRF